VPPSTRRFVLAASVFVWAGAAFAQSGPTAPIGDPKKCVVVVEELKNVGFRIGDAQMVAETLLNGLRKRVSQDGAMYEGAMTSVGQLNKMLGQSIEGGTVQQRQIDYYKACIANAPWRVHAKLVGKTGIEVTCKKADDKEPVEKKKFEGKNFVDARDKLVAAIPTFCTQIPDISMIPLEPAPGEKPGEIPGMSKKKETKPWTPPPRRD
jgi:hypothetical protein